MEKIIFRQNVLDYFDELFLALFYKEYFGFEDAANNYVSRIIDFIHNDISTFPHKLTPKELRHLGSKYIFYKANPRTVWYVFFENKKEKYIVTGIINSHSNEAKYL